MSSLSIANARMILLVVFFLALAGCGKASDPPPERRTSLTPEQEIAAEERAKAFERKNVELEQVLTKISTVQLRSILQRCKSAVLKLARSQNGSPFEVFLVDEYSADSYQAASHVGGGNVSSEESRIQRFLRARKAKEAPLRYSLELSYTVMFTYDSPFGAQKQPRRFSCDLESDLSVRAS